MSDSPRCPQSHDFRMRQRLTDNEKTRALERASAFNSENPFFMVVLQLSYVNGGGSLVSFQYKACWRITSLVNFNLQIRFIN